MKALSALLIGGLISGGVATFAPGYDSDSLLRDSVKTLGDLMTDEEGLAELEAELNAEGNKSIQIEFQESTITTAYEEDGDGKPSDCAERKDEADNDVKPAAKPRSLISGKIVIIDAEGKRKEYQINGDQAMMLQSMQKPSISDFNDGEKDENAAKPEDGPGSATEERFVLGVQCEEADELLRAHLKLGSKGLVILEVREETPAAEAGLKKDDIIVSINDTDLESLEQLVKVVSESDGSSVKLSIVRAGDRQEVPVTPRKMQVPTMVVPARMDVEEIHNLLDKGATDVRVRRIHPGLLIEGGIPGEQKDVQAIIESLRQMAEQGDSGNRRDSHIVFTPPGKGNEAAIEQETQGETQTAVKQLQEQVQQLQDQLTELQMKIQRAESDSDKL